MRTTFLIIGTIISVYALFVATLYFVGKKSAARAIGGFVPDCVILFKRLLSDTSLPRRHKIVIVMLITYLILPIDIVPDFVPVIGQIDDAILVALTLRYVLRGTGRELAIKHWPGPHESLDTLLKLAGNLK